MIHVIFFRSTYFNYLGCSLLLRTDVIPLVLSSELKSLRIIRLWNCLLHGTLEWSWFP